MWWFTKKKKKNILISVYDLDVIWIDVPIDWTNCRIRGNQFLIDAHSLTETKIIDLGIPKYDWSIRPQRYPSTDTYQSKFPIIDDPNEKKSK